MLMRGQHKIDLSHFIQTMSCHFKLQPFPVIARLPSIKSSCALPFHVKMGRRLVLRWSFVCTLYTPKKKWFVYTNFKGEENLRSIDETRTTFVTLEPISAEMDPYLLMPRGGENFPFSFINQFLHHIWSSFC